MQVSLSIHDLHIFRKKKHLKMVWEELEFDEWSIIQLYINSFQEKIVSLTILNLRNSNPLPSPL